MGDDVLSMWTVYREPRDMPGVAFAARRFEVSAGAAVATNDFVTGDTLEGIRRALPRGLTLLSRHPNDDPVIVETWI